MKKDYLMVNSIISWFKYLLIAIFPIMSLYKFLPLISIGYFCIILIIIIDLFKENFKTKINLDIIITMSFLIFINFTVGIIKYNEIQNTINNSIGMAVFMVLASFTCVSDKFDKDKLYKALKWVSLISTLFLCYQYIGYNFLGVVIKGNISFLELNDIGFGSIEYGRPSSFFLEPAHYAIYMAPIYAIALSKKEYIFSGIIIIGLLLSSSTTGIIIILAIPFNIFILNNNKNLVKKLLIIVALILLGLVILSNVSDSFFTKISIEGLRVNTRIGKPITYLLNFSFLEWFFGIGLNRLDNFLLLQGYELATNYANSILFAIISFGLVGGSIWIIFLVNLYKKTKSKLDSVYLVLIMISLSDQILFNRNLLYLLLCVYTFSINGKKRIYRKGSNKQ